MKILCALSTALRLTALTFAAGFIVGLILGYQVTVGPTQPDRSSVAGTTVLATDARTLGWSYPID